MPYTVHEISDWVNWADIKCLSKIESVSAQDASVFKACCDRALNSDLELLSVAVSIFCILARFVGK